MPAPTSPADSTGITSDVMRSVRCILSFHRWVMKQDSSDAPRYRACARCGRTKVFDPINGGDVGRNMYLFGDKSGQP